MALIIIVLGNSVLATMKKRMDRAIKYFREETERAKADLIKYSDSAESPCLSSVYLLLSGGQIGADKPCESEFMRDYAIEQGVDPQVIIIENESKNTIENFEKCKKILQEMFPTTVGITPNVVVCTSTFHIRRSRLLAELLLKKYNCRYIHTDEPTSSDETYRENVSIIRNINFIFQQQQEIL